MLAGGWSDMDGTSESFRAAKFSIPAYLVGMLAAGEVVAIALCIGLIVGSQNGLVIVPIALLVAPISALFALPLMLPAALLTLFVANRWKIRRPLFYGLLGAGFGGANAALVVLVKSPPETAAYGLVLGAMGGFTAGAVYRWMDLQNLRNVLT